MRRLLFALFTVTCLSAAAQSPEGSNWQHVQALPAGTSLHIDARSGNITCKLKSVTGDSITCTHAKETTIQRSEIKTIKLAHRGRSAAAGTAIGAATGVVAVEAAWNNNWRWNAVNRGSVAAYAGVPLAGVGAVVGYFTDFTRSTIYRAQ
jgi:hypothetical protein